MGQTLARPKASPEYFQKIEPSLGGFWVVGGWLTPQGSWVGGFLEKVDGLIWAEVSPGGGGALSEYIAPSPPAHTHSQTMQGPQDNHQRIKTPNGSAVPVKSHSPCPLLFLCFNFGGVYTLRTTNLLSSGPRAPVPPDEWRPNLSVPGRAPL